MSKTTPKSLIRLQKIKDLQTEGISDRNELAERCNCTRRTIDRYLANMSELNLGQLTVDNQSEKRTEIAISLFESANEVYSLFLERSKTEKNDMGAQKYYRLYLQSIDKLITLYQLSANFGISQAIQINNQVPVIADNFSAETNAKLREIIISEHENRVARECRV